MFGVWVDRMEGSIIKIVNFMKFRNLFSTNQKKTSGACEYTPRQRAFTQLAPTNFPKSGIQTTKRPEHQAAVGNSSCNFVPLIKSIIHGANGTLHASRFKANKVTGQDDRC